MFKVDAEEDESFIKSIQPLPKNIIERDVFHSDDFDPDRFLASRRHLGLERLKTELNGHLSFLKNELIELINRDYQDFINLSTNLRGVDKAIVAFQQPLTQMQSQVKDAQGHFQTLINELDQKLEHRAKIRDRKTSLKLLLNIHDSVSKVEELLEINTDTKESTDTQAVLVNGQPSEEEGFLGKQIERVAVEYNQMQHLVNRGKHLEFVTENEWRITRINDILQLKLSKALSQALQKMAEGQVNKSAQQSMTQCLRIYALIDQTHVAEQIIRGDFVHHFLQSIITKNPSFDKDKPATSSLPPTADTFPLTAMYNAVLRFASNELNPILDITQHRLKGTNYEVLVNALWVEVVELINRNCAFIYAAGQTDACHKNYTASIQFITSLENLFHSKKSLLYFRNHPSYATFMKRWQLPVYFQLRFREIISKVEDQLRDSSKQHITKPENDQALALKGSKAIAHAIATCWSDQVFLFVLSHRFWKLTLQLLTRYKIWAIDLIDRAMESQEDSSRPATPGVGANGSDPGPIDESLVVVLACDIDRLVRLVKKQANDVIFEKMPNNVHDVSLLKESMDEMLDSLETSTSHEIDKRVTGVISRRCMESLKLVKSIFSQYRQPNKPRPKEPSHFIPNIFKPFRAFIDQNQPWISDAKASAWAVMIIDMVVFRYTLIISDLLDNLKKQDDTLKKFKRGNKTGFSRSLFGSGDNKANANDTMTDSEKIQLQFVLDVQQLGLELDKLGVKKEDLECYTKLCQTTKPFEHLLTSCPSDQQ
ncbi:COG complex component [Hesseltinella vesiculosa]|uniref:Conserved oligomeric Golgi complex subunit 2 n=1 Tax=Hesseltinella vesiculosa TaxID=101127 RepID=A0A1X2GTQ1_9FUNG|nr:COG complex component [Hesseltinella vesiculosa]